MKLVASTCESSQERPLPPTGCARAPIRNEDRTFLRLDLCLREMKHFVGRRATSPRRAQHERALMGYRDRFGDSRYRDKTSQLLSSRTLVSSDQVPPSLRCRLHERPDSSTSLHRTRSVQGVSSVRSRATLPMTHPGCNTMAHVPSPLGSLFDT